MFVKENISSQCDSDTVHFVWWVNHTFNASFLEKQEIPAVIGEKGKTDGNKIQHDDGGLDLHGITFMSVPGTCVMTLVMMYVVMGRFDVTVGI